MLTETGSFVIKQNAWHIYDAQKPHAVHNVADTRIVLMTVISDNLMSLDRFLLSHKSLI
jgi:hypothetical protein